MERTRHLPGTLETNRISVTDSAFTAAGWNRRKQAKTRTRGGLPGFPRGGPGESYI